MLEKIWTLFEKIGVTFSICNSDGNNIKAGKNVNDGDGNNVNSGSGNVIDNSVHIVAQEPKRRSYTKSPLQDINRFLKDLETEKDDVCSKCGVTVHLSFPEPIEIAGSYEIKGTACPSCKTLILEVRKFTTEQKRRFDGKLNIKKVYGPWKKYFNKNENE